MRRPSMRVDTGRATPGVRLSRGGQNGAPPSGGAPVRLRSGTQICRRCGPGRDRGCLFDLVGCALLDGGPARRFRGARRCLRAMRGAARSAGSRVRPGSEFEHGGVGLGDAFPPRSEVDEYRDVAVAFHADGPAEAVLVVSDAVADGEVLARCFDPGLEGAGGQDAADCCRFRHSLQYAPEIARAGPSGAFNFGVRQERPRAVQRAPGWRRRAWRLAVRGRGRRSAPESTALPIPGVGSADRAGGMLNEASLQVC